MAGDWIKMRTSLLTNPKVNGIARALEDMSDVCKVLSTGYNGVMSQIVTRTVMRHVTVSSLLVIWGAANEHTKDGIFHNADFSDVDDMVGFTGFAEAMESVGWLIFDEELCTLTLPNFNEYNTSGSERGASSKTGSERQKEYRERKKLLESVTESDVTQHNESDVTRNHREEKRREEKKEIKTLVISQANDKPDCPHQDIISVYHEVLPQCPKVRDWTQARQTQLRTRWNESADRQNLDYWRRLFEYVGECDFLTGRTAKPFFADLEWITKTANFTKIRERKYENRVAA